MKTIMCLFIVTLVLPIFAQQRTVGLLTNTAESYNGYTLFTPNASKITYLMDNCGKVVKQWTSEYEPGQTVYLLENGNLLHSARITGNRTFGMTGGAGGRVELLSWDGVLLWGYDYSGTTFMQHHDAISLPNGNVLLLSWDARTEAEVMAAGRNPALYPASGLWSEKIVELQPVGKDSARVVWEWKLWDHLVQDFDATKANYGVVADKPELLDVNFLNKTNVASDWIHFNGLAYNAELDQIVVSSRELSEIFILDHSTTTAEAASHKGGKAGRGGDFLYRWGNPQSYRRGTASNRTLYGQHNPQWITQGLPGAGNLLIYNNGDTRPDGRYSTIEEIKPPLTANGTYSLSASAAYGPDKTEWTYKASTPTSFYSSNISGSQRLPNGNTLICEGSKGKFFEVTSAGKIVWTYQNPVTTGGVILSQGAMASNAGVFRTLRYAPSYPALSGKTLITGQPVEQNPGTYDCTITTSVQSAPEGIQLTVKHNPASEDLIAEILLHKPQSVAFQLYDLYGRKITERTTEQKQAGSHTVTIPLYGAAQGVYVVVCVIQQTVFTKTLVLVR